MKKFLTWMPIAGVVLVLFSFAIAFGAEELVTGEITDVVQAVDQNGASYTRLIVSFDRKLNGTEYSVGLPVMGFGDQAEPASQLTVGQTLKAICSKRTYQDRESYTIIKLLNE